MPTIFPSAPSAISLPTLRATPPVPNEVSKLPSVFSRMTALPPAIRYFPSGWTFSDEGAVNTRPALAGGTIGSTPALPKLVSSEPSGLNLSRAALTVGWLIRV
jgi:hypothetical protein